MLKALQLPQPKALDDVLAESSCHPPTPPHPRPKSQLDLRSNFLDFCSCFLFLNVQSNSKQFIFLCSHFSP